MLRGVIQVHFGFMSMLVRIQKKMGLLKDTFQAYVTCKLYELIYIGNYVWNKKSYGYLIIQ